MTPRLMIGFPLYHQVPADFFTNWLSIDKTAAMGTTVVNGAYITTAMHLMVTNALEVPDWDRLVVIEHDMILPHHALARIAHYKPEHHIVGSFYFGHDAPHNAVVYMENPDRTHGSVTPQTVNDWCKESSLHRVDTVGFGLTSIARHVLEDWDPDIPMFSMDKVLGGHDMWFCHYARKQGYDVYADSGIVCEHLSQIRVGMSHNQDCAYMTATEVTHEFGYSEV